LRTDITGNDYLKAPVDEHFAMEGDSAHWKSTSEDGRSAAPGFYISTSGPGVEFVLLVDALLKAKGAAVKLLPAGEARLERLADTTVADHYQKLHVTEYAVTGLGFEPQTVWLDDDHHFFATPGKWFAVIREGWEATNDQLYALTLSAEDARNTRLANELARHPTHPVAIEHVRLFDSVRAVNLDDQTVIVNGDRITAVGAA